ncbi:hypothetical protein CVU83_02065 [Candidatus Falkowbacteria bacterium HGW-Falkowbacteria-2]|uniref:Uncharacterized protein n=1 Tax=Candidatus Falkowbacteria bacterium HGW-Falkowbacteria-2 TaxID=2013769 RepID=A0A2N2E0L0_9BACT|nr:MAG: hypothetical protein CVU83_02065 [Candidatus Falkowbacteria bacterium HGW-Falkowbacteria-2]
MVFAFVTYILARVIMPDNIEWWARELFALVIAGGLLAGIGQAVDKRTAYAKSVATFLFVVFAYFMITGYAENVDSTPIASKKIAATVLSEGVNLFDLQPGESTGWLTFKEGTKSTYSVASESYEYHMYYSDGTDYVGAENSTIPQKKHSVFYVLSTSKERQIVKITVTRII